MFELLGQLIVGWILADLFTGTFHFLEDEFGKEDWPIVGPWLIVPNRLHHVDALAFGKGSFWNRNLASINAAILFAAGWTYFYGMMSPWMVAFLVGGAFSNEIHWWAHSPKSAPWWGTMLQEIGIFQSPKMHAKHHAPPFQANYCVMTNWLNPVLERVQFFQSIKKVFS